MEDVFMVIGVIVFLVLCLVAAVFPVGFDELAILAVFVGIAISTIKNLMERNKHG